MLVTTDQAGTDCEIQFLPSKTKENTVTYLEAFDTRVEMQFGVCLRYVHIDSRKEFDNNLQEAYCRKHDI